MIVYVYGIGVIVVYRFDMPTFAAIVHHLLLVGVPVPSSEPLYVRNIEEHYGDIKFGAHIVKHATQLR